MSSCSFTAAPAQPVSATSKTVASSPAIGTTLLFLLPWLLLCEWLVFSNFFPAQAAEKICFFFPLIEQTLLATPGVFTGILILLLYVQQQILHHDSARRRQPRQPAFYASQLVTMSRQSLSLGLLPACFIVSLPYAISAVTGIHLPSAPPQLMLAESGLESAGPGANQILNHWLTSLLTCLGAGFYEEVVFRVACCSWLISLGTIFLRQKTSCLWLGILGSSFMFALAHEPLWWQNPAELDGLNLLMFSFRFLSGVMLAAINLHWGTGVAIGTHSSFNLALLMSEI